MLLLCCLCLSPIAHAFVLRPTLRLRPEQLTPRLRPCTACADDESSSPPARDLSSELNKYETRRLRITQSGPARFVSGALEDASVALRSLSAFGGGVLRVVPVHQGLLGLTVLAFGAQQLTGQAAMVAGARINQAIIQGGQWHRLVSPVFLHGSVIHLASNAISLARIGPLVEGAYGGRRVLLIYLLSGISGNLTGLWFGQGRAMSVGASGAVLGLLGAAAAFALRNKRALGRGADALLTQATALRNRGCNPVQSSVQPCALHHIARSCNYPCAPGGPAAAAQPRHRAAAALRHRQPRPRRRRRCGRCAGPAPRVLGAPSRRRQRRR